MSEHKEFSIGQFPDYKVVGLLFTDVTNQEEIKTNLINSNEDYNFAFINCDNIVSLEQIYSTLYKSLLDQSFDRMKSKTLHTEIIFNLSPQKNIMDCLNKFGISKTSNNIIALKALKSTVTDEEVNNTLESLKSKVSGRVVPFTNESLSSFVNLKTLKKNYKLGAFDTSDVDVLTRLTVDTIQLKGL